MKRCDVDSDDSKPLRVLVAEDDDVRRLLVAALGRRFDVANCASGREALRALAQDRPEVVLVDLDLPGLCGEALALRAGVLPDPPVVYLMSGDHQRLHLARRLAGRTVPKPFSVLDRVRELGTHRQASSVA